MQRSNITTTATMGISSDAYRKMIAERASNKDTGIFIWKTIQREESSIYLREKPNSLPLPTI